MTANDNEKSAIVAVLQHLKAAEANGNNPATALKSAVASLTEAYAITADDLIKYAAPGGTSFPDVYMEGRKAITDANSNTTTTTPQDEDPAFLKFLNRLKGTAFFAGVEEGSEEYARRVSKARAKFANRFTDNSNSAKSPTAAAAADSAARSSPITTPAASEETKAKADALKLEGNAFLKAKEYDKAKDTYTQCITLDGNNAIYYGNRAASKMHLSEYASAVDDCKMAISIDPAYARAHERLASAYRSLGMDEAELEALENACRIHPENQQLQKLLDNAKARKNPTAAPAGMGGMPSADMLSSMAASMGLPNISPEMVSGFMNSPMGAQMANAFAQGGGANPMMDAMNNSGGGGMPEALEALKNNPEMMSKAAEALKNNPDLVSEAMKAMMGGGGGQGPRPPPPGII